MGAASLKRPTAICSAGQYQRAAAQSKATTRTSTSSKRKTLERVATAEAPSSTLNRTGGDRNKADMSLRKARKRRSTDRSLHNTAVSADTRPPTGGLLFLSHSGYIIYTVNRTMVVHPTNKIPNGPASSYFSRFGCVPKFGAKIVSSSHVVKRALGVQERGQVQQEIAANRLDRKQRAAAFLRLRFDRSMQMLQAGGDPDDEPGGSSKATERQMKADRDLQDISLFIYRLESDFEDKRCRLEKMLSGFNPTVSLQGNICAFVHPQHAIHIFIFLNRKHDAQVEASQQSTRLLYNPFSPTFVTHKPPPAPRDWQLLYCCREPTIASPEFLDMHLTHPYSICRIENI